MNPSLEINRHLSELYFRKSKMKLLVSIPSILLYYVTREYSEQLGVTICPRTFELELLRSWRASIHSHGDVDLAYEGSMNIHGMDHMALRSHRSR